MHTFKLIALTITNPVSISLGNPVQKVKKGVKRWTTRSRRSGSALREGGRKGPTVFTCHQLISINQPSGYWGLA